MSDPNRLGGDQAGQLNDALLSAFPQEGDLERLIWFKLNIERGEIAGWPNTADVVLDLIRVCKARGRVAELINAARNENPGNQLLQKFAEAYFAPMEPRSTNPPLPQAREITRHILLACSREDEAFARQVADQFERRGLLCLLSREALFAQRPRQHQDLDSEIRQCHTAMIVLSDAAIDRLEGQPESTQSVLRVLQARTGHVVALCQTEKALKRAADWGLAIRFDVSGWTAKIGVGQSDLLSTIEEGIRSQIPSSQGGTIGLPFVVVAMTHDEAMELEQQGEALVKSLSAERLQKYQALAAALADLDPSSFAQRYSSARDSWKPFVGKDQSIRSAIEDLVKALNEDDAPALRGKTIKMQSYPFDALVQDEKSLRLVYNDVAQTGCVVIVDELSMYHPQVSQALSTSYLYSSKSVSWITISPWNPYGRPPLRLLEEALENELAFAFERFSLDLEPQCEIGVGDELRFRRWLTCNLPLSLHALRDPRPSAPAVEKFVAEVGAEHGLNGRRIPTMEAYYANQGIV